MNRLRSAAVILASLLVPLTTVAEETIHVAYSERPPYMVPLPDGTPSGLTGTPTVHAFKTAGIPVQWHKVPTNRQLAMVKDAKSLNCAVGWFMLPDRLQYAKFTKPIYRDRTWLVLTNDAFAARGIATLEELTRQRDIRVLVKDNYSYGGLDAYIRQWHPVMAVSTASTVKMVQSVSKGAVDLMFVSDEEGSYLLKQHAADANNLRLLSLKDMPRGPERYIMCSKAVPDEVIARLNKAITFR